MFKMDAYVLYLVLLLSLTETSSGKNIQCPEGYFMCDKGTCIGFEYVCDGIVNCEDESDENCKEPENGKDIDGKSAAVAAARYFIAQVDSKMDDFVPRAAITLSFLGPLTPFSEMEMRSTVDLLNGELLTVLDKGIENIKLHSLALYINALYATCEDPRSFHNNDLVEILRAETDRAKSNFNRPVVTLTLCLAKEVRFEELNQLLKIYDDQRNFRICNKALTLLVMAACQRQGTADHFNEMKKRMDDFVRRFQNSKNIGAYSKAMICQVYNAWGLDSSALQSELLRLQAEDGSIQDTLVTYAAIPALLNTSLADLQCKTRVYQAKPKRRSDTAVQLFNPKRYVEYTMSIPYGQENPGNHSLTIYYEGRKSLFEIMKTAKNLNPMFRFTFEEVTGIKVTSLGGISNDEESTLAWTLYKRTTDQSAENSGKDNIESGDIDLVYPQDGDHYIFKLEYGRT